MMGVGYKHYLIPRDNTYRPEPEQLSRLVNALHEAGFLGEFRVRPDQARVFNLDCDEDIDPETPFAAQLGMRRWKPFPCPGTEQDFAALDGEEYRLAWSVESHAESGLIYPLNSDPDLADACYELEFHVVNDFIYETSEAIDSFEDGLICSCGCPLEYNPKVGSDDIWTFRLHRRCPWCGIPFRPQDHTAHVRDARLGDVSECPGGATYLFAIVVDCNKCFPQDWPILASESFLDTVTKALGQSFYELGSPT